MCVIIVTWWSSSLPHGTLNARTNMTVVHCNMIYIDTANSDRNMHQSHDTTSRHSEHSYDTDKHQSYRSQQASVATSIGHSKCNIHNTTNLYRQTSLSQNVHNIYTQQTSIQDRQVLVTTRLNTYTLQTSNETDNYWLQRTQHSQSMHNKNVSFTVVHNKHDIWHWYYTRYWLTGKE